MWSYEDAQGVWQGPFAATQVQAWASVGYLPPSTRVRHARDTEGTHRVLGYTPQLGGADPRVSAATAADHCGDAAAGAADDLRLSALCGGCAGSLEHSCASSSAAAATPTAVGRGGYVEYRVAGGFNPHNGRFTASERQVTARRVHSCSPRQTTPARPRTPRLPASSGRWMAFSRRARRPVRGRATRIGRPRASPPTVRAG